MAFSLTSSGIRNQPQSFWNTVLLFKVIRPGALMLILLFAGQAKALQAVVMHNIFYSPGENNKQQLIPYVEAYWQINPETISFKLENEIWKGRVRTDISVKNEDGIINEEHYILETLPIKDKSKVLTQKIIDLRRFQLPAGKIVIEVKLTDLLKPGNELVYKDSFTVDAVDRRPFISDIQLVDTTIPSTEQNTFQRNNRIQIPLCTNFLDDTRKTLRYYSEIYNAYTLEPDQQPLIRKVFISKKEYERVHNTVVKTDTILPALLQIGEGQISVASFESGNYYLNIILEDKDKNPVAAKSLFFQLMNTQPIAAATNAVAKDSATEAPVVLELNKTFLAKYSFAQVRAILKMMLPIADPNERNRINDFIKVADEMYSRYFVYNFWLTRNKLNPELEWKQYSEKVKEVNKLFGSSMLPGYETERGYTYIKYGKPTERIVVENEQGSVPYEIWQYNSIPNATNAVFLFYRPGFISNDYKLLHTTVNTEVRNRNWRAELYSNTSGATRSGNSRAEQYLGNR